LSPANAAALIKNRSATPRRMRKIYTKITITARATSRAASAGHGSNPSTGGAKIGSVHTMFRSKYRDGDAKKT
jgi:hypothetical protein